MKKLIALATLFFPSIVMAGVHVQQNDPNLTIGSMTVLGAATFAGAGPILSTTTLQSGATFFVTSGTVSGNFYASTIFATNLTNGQCVQTGPGGQLTGTGLTCGSGGGGNSILNQSTLQAGATGYPDFIYVGTSQTVNGILTYQNGANQVLLYPTVVGKNGISTTGGYQIGWGNSQSNISSPGASPFVATFQNINQLFNGQNFTPPSFLPGGIILGTTFYFDGPQVSTVVYGLAVGSETINGPGNGLISLTVGTSGVAPSSYTVTASSSIPIVGNYAIWTSTNFTVGSVAPSATSAAGGFGELQISSPTGTFAASTNWSVYGSSINFNNGSLNSDSPYSAGRGVVDIRNNGGVGNILTLSDSNNGQNVIFPAGGEPKFFNGLKSTCLDYGGVGAEQLTEACNSASQFINFWTGGSMILQTVNGTSGNSNDFVFKPAQTEELRVSSTTNITITGNTGPSYSLSISTSSSQYQVRVSTNGGTAFFSRTLAQLGSIVPNFPGETYYCSNCTTDDLCTSTQTVTATYARMGARTTPCQ